MFKELKDRVSERYARVISSISAWAPARAASAWANEAGPASDRELALVSAGAIFMTASMVATGVVGDLAGSAAGSGWLGLGVFAVTSLTQIPAAQAAINPIAASEISPSVHRSTTDQLTFIKNRLLEAGCTHRQVSYTVTDFLSTKRALILAKKHSQVISELLLDQTGRVDEQDRVRLNQTHSELTETIDILTSHMEKILKGPLPDYTKETIEEKHQAQLTEKIVEERKLFLGSHSSAPAVAKAKQLKEKPSVSQGMILGQ